ncbi:hypothetical protein HG536_0G02420 [Torulaspora globosa]|uniref:UPF3 domain-containing protein n=1 Tax=Torulaspora globosa TaxID=48254 RepID=A0A7G3ZLJ5_9SACH|nr:uncharacterized protein HG536_0G02420 [Torulaspora globosa]QLL34381.1 hypothetical protein HG536_0G02420 [Torulaspora globosa]
MDGMQPSIPRDPFRNKEAGSLKPNQVNEDENCSRTTSTSSRKPGTSKSKVGRARRRDRHGRKSDDSGFKLVLRLLPPDLSEDEFLKTLKTEIGDMINLGIDGWYYVQGHYSVKFRSEPVYSRCYLYFNDMEQLGKFASRVQPIRFVDDKDNAANAVAKVSPYNKRLVTDPPKNAQSKQSLEGTIKEDPLFQTFLKSLKILEERTSDYSYADVSIMKPLEKELAKRRSIESEIEKRTEMALIALTGDIEKKSKSKGKKKNKKKDKVSKEAGEVATEPTSSVDRKRKKAKKKTTKPDVKTNNVEKNNNVVILEAAGRKELQRRKKLQMEKEKMAGRADPAVTKKKSRSKGKPSDSSGDIQNLSNLKLKRETAEHS